MYDVKKQNNNMIMYKKDTVHNVTQLKQYDVQKNTLYIMCHNVKKIIIQWCTKKHAVHNVSQYKKK